MPEEPKTLSLTMPAGLADRLQRALETQHITLEQIVLQWLLFGRRGVRPRPNIPAHFFYEAKTKTLDFALTVPAEVADRIPPAPWRQTRSLWNESHWDGCFGGDCPSSTGPKPFRARLRPGFLPRRRRVDRRGFERAERHKELDAGRAVRRD
jgi:hypothetical protein